VIARASLAPAAMAAPFVIDAGGRHHEARNAARARVDSTLRLTQVFGP
jgi:hypothetical protein